MRNMKECKSFWEHAEGGDRLKDETWINGGLSNVNVAVSGYLIVIGEIGFSLH